MKLAIKIDVDTYKGTKEGVLPLCELFDEMGVPATFLFSLGPDNTGKALKKIFRKGFLQKCLKSDVKGNYGIKTLLYGTLLPAPLIAKNCADVMRKVSEMGFECGVHSWNHFNWQENLFSMGEIEVEKEFNLAFDKFEEVFGYKAKTCGAAGWQISKKAISLQDEYALLYASDTRASEPFFPTIDGQDFNTLQIPTTLMTLDELLGNVKKEDIFEFHLEQMKKQEYSVMTIHSELEGMAYLEFFAGFLKFCKKNNVEFYSLEGRAKDLLKDPSSIKRLPIKMKTFQGRSGLLAQV